MEQTTDAVFFIWLVGSLLVFWFLDWNPKSPDIPLEEYEEANQGAKEEDDDNLC
jgi:hypothetical protein